VDEVGAVAHQLQPASDRRLRGEVISAVRERVGGDVEDPHDQAAARPRHPEHLRGRRGDRGGRHLTSRPARPRAAARGLDSSMAIVIGPTPPGTGVINPAIPTAASKSTSPRRPFPSLWIPTSITVAPGRIASAPTRPGTPAATTRT